MSKGYTASGYLPSQGETAMSNMEKEVQAEIQEKRVNNGRRLRSFWHLACTQIDRDIMCLRMKNDDIMYSCVGM